MKINADERNFIDTFDIINDAIEILSGWSEKHRVRAVYCLDAYIHDWYFDYELTEEEAKEVEDEVKDAFTYYQIYIESPIGRVKYDIGFPYESEEEAIKDCESNDWVYIDENKFEWYMDYKEVIK